MFAALALLVATAPVDLGAPRDEALDRAAGALAALAAAREDLAPIADSEALRLEVTRAGAQVAEPYALGIWARIPADGLRMLAERTRGLGHLRPTAAGLGRARVADGSEVLVALLTRSPVALATPLPPSAAPGTLLPLRGRLTEGLRHPQLHVTPPGGRPVRLPLARDGEAFVGKLHLAREGATVVEVIGVGPDGPEVALLAHVHVGGAVPTWRAAAAVVEGSAPERDPREDASWIAGRIAALRAERGLPPLRIDPELARVAQGYAEELARGTQLTHRSADGRTVGDRLAAAGIRKRGVGENLGEGPTAAAAHEAILRSPAHLAILLEPTLTEIGIGVARRRVGGGVVVVQLVAAP